MHKFFALAGVAAVLILIPARADASCCDQSMPAMHDMKAGCCDMPCCKDAMTPEPKAEPKAPPKDEPKPEASAIELLISMDPQFALAQVTPPPTQRTETPLPPK